MHTNGSLKPSRTSGNWITTRFPNPQTVKFTLTDPVRGRGTLFVKSSSIDGDGDVVHVYEKIPESDFLTVIGSSNAGKFIQGHIHGKFSCSVRRNRIPTKVSSKEESRAGQNWFSKVQDVGQGDSEGPVE